MLILILMALNITVSAYAVLLPVFARDVFAGNATTLGWLWARPAAGLSGNRLPGTAGVCPRSSARWWRGFISAASILVFALAPICPGDGGDGRGLRITVQRGHQHAAAGHGAGSAAGRVVSFFTSARFGFDAAGRVVRRAAATAIGAGPTLLVEGPAAGFCRFLLTRRKRLRSLVAKATWTESGEITQAFRPYTLHLAEFWSHPCATESLTPLPSCTSPTAPISSSSAAKGRGCTTTTASATSISSRAGRSTASATARRRSATRW
jgi:hypothetical protein